MKRIVTVFGTRPEAIKLAPVIIELQRHVERMENLVCVTAQHREMLDQVLDWFQIKPHIDLDLMKPDQGLPEFVSDALLAVHKMLRELKPDLVLVQGDTATVMVTALAAFYLHIPVGHVEAGLRTRELYDPFPEEINRRMAGVLSTYHFAPTARAAAALRAEKIPEQNIFFTGNTVVDALLMTVNRPLASRLDVAEDGHRRIILVTAHRRESFGAPFESLCLALNDIAERNHDVQIVYPVHLNPNVRDPVFRLLGGHERISLINPLRYEQFAHLMSRAYLILTDSGGIQEEAPVLGKPTLVMRATTERPEAIEAGTARLVGTDRGRIVAETERLLSDASAYSRMACAGSPFGDGHAAERIVNALLGRL
ncbi:MAG: UDP-N-acetylglucosamine 2-epimerase [Desulfatitalea sp. BRH_c12]|nr:MAG: UDP-N-acetylglucosamine 2-epimerase [Desulfatitalea sp. BRH_c12]